MEANSPGVRTTSVVVVGRFNPAILVPAWIVKEGVLSDGEVEIGQTLGASVVQFRLSGFMWRSSPSKLEVHAEKEGLDPGEFAAKILELLPHTPVRGVGNNFAVSFEGDAGDNLGPLAFSPLAAVVPAPSNEILAQGATLTLPYEGDAVIQVGIDVEQAQAEVRFNFHRDCASATAGAEAARRWNTDREEAGRLLERILAYAHDSTRSGNQHTAT